MSRSSAEDKYWKALERIQSGHTLIVDINKPGFRISNLSVALEAGKENPKGYIRPQRYPELCDAIRAAVNDKALSPPSVAKNQTSEVEKRRAMNARYNELRADYEKLLEQFLNVVKENFELKAHIASKMVQNKSNRRDHR